jgi:hypothetical protein
VYTAAVYFKKRSATVVAYVPTLNGKPLVLRTERGFAEGLAAGGAVRRRWMGGRAASVRLGPEGVVAVLKRAGCGSVDLYAVDRYLRRVYRKVRDVLMRAAEERAGELAERYVRAWLKSVNFELPGDDEDAAAVSRALPRAVVWAYGKYSIQLPPWC